MLYYILTINIKKMEKAIYSYYEGDQSTGEVLKSQRIVKTTLESEHFLKAYTADICHLCRCKGAEISLVLASLKFVDYNTNEIRFSVQDKKDIATYADITTNTFNSAIQRLYKKNIFVKINGRTYLNPKLFFIGTDIEREKVLKFTIEYHLKD